MNKTLKIQNTLRVQEKIKELNLPLQRNKKGYFEFMFDIRDRKNYQNNQVRELGFNPLYTGHQRYAHVL